MKKTRKIIVYIATSTDGYIARRDGDMAWLTKRPAAKGFYGWGTFIRSIDAKIMGRETFELSVKMGASFRADDAHYVFSRRPPPASVPAGVQFVTEPIGAFAKRLRSAKGKNVFMMGGGELIASFLDEGEIDEFIINVIPSTFIGEGIPLISQRHRDVPLLLQRVRPCRDGVVQLHYVVEKHSRIDGIAVR
jgi:dihydrofolate reductase